jgi:LytS/YehU family sensor histidine kinase
MSDPSAWPDLQLQTGQGQAAPVPFDLTAATARRVAAIVQHIAAVDAVAITDTAQILALEGAGCPHMHPGRPVQTDATRTVLRTGEGAFIATKAELHCPVAGCPCSIQAAVIAPLKIRGHVVGTVKFYHRHSSLMPEFIQRLAVGISELLSLQLELEEAEHQRELLAQARLQALQAQIHPHFLFNTLNTIIATSRVDPELARELLAELATFLRHTISQQASRSTLAQELDFVHMYVRLEHARFGDRLQTTFRVDPAILDIEVPVLTLQPLVENAIVHGLAPKDGLGRLTVAARRRGASVCLAVVDDGVGFADGPHPLGTEGSDGRRDGLGLANVNQRLIGLCGPEARLRIRSRAGRGTLVAAHLPATDGESEREAKGTAAS